MSNNGGFTMGIVNQAADAFFEDKMEPKEEAEKEEEDSEEDEIKLSEETLKKYVGKFKMDMVAFSIEYKLENGALIAYPKGQDSRPIKAISDTSFTYEGVDATVIFHVNGEEEVKTATHIQGGGKMKMTKFVFDPEKVVPEDYVGTYYSKELQTSYEVLVKEDKWVARHFNLEDIELTATKQDEFSSSVFFFGELKFQRDTSGNVVSFLASNGRTKDVLFEKQ